MNKDYKIKEVQSDIYKLNKEILSKKNELEILLFAKEFVNDKSIFRHTVNNKTFFLYRFEPL